MEKTECVVCVSNSRPRVNYIDRLPNELLREIAECLYFTEPNIRKFRLFRTLRILSHVSRRFRLVTLPLLWRKLDFTSRHDFTLFMGYLRGHNGPVQHASCTKALRVGFIDRKNPVPLAEIALTLTQYLTNLVTFQCPYICSNLATLEALSALPRLRRFDFQWDDVAGWPKLELLQGLRTVRLYVTSSRVRRPQNPPSRLPVNHEEMLPYSSITSFSLEACCVSDLTAQCTLYLKLPQLQICSFIMSFMEPSNIFWFVHRHPTLLEVTVLSQDLVRPEALVKLADGTGIWSPGSQSGSAEVCTETPGFYDYLGTGLPPSFAHNLHIGISDFTFTRAPRNQVSGNPLRYGCTTLAVCIQKTFGVEDVETGVWSNFTLTINKLLHHNPLLVELRVMSPTETDNFDEDFNVAAFMEAIAQAAAGQREHHLRKLTVYWTNYYWAKCDWSPQEQMRQYLNWPYLNNVEPPSGRINNFSHTACLRDIDEWELPCGMDMKDFDDAIRDALAIDEDEDLDREDDSLLMRAWEACNERRVAELISNIATHHLALEEFDWWVRCEFTGYVRWRWTITRGNVGDVVKVRGKLTWTRCSSDYAHPRPSFTGERLSRILDSLEVDPSIGLFYP